jgi:hypothetical protein
MGSPLNTPPETFTNTFSGATFDYWRSVEGLEYPAEAMENDNETIDWLVYVGYSERISATQNWIGYPVIKTDYSQSPPVQYISRIIPFGNPEWLNVDTGNPFMWCTRVETKPHSFLTDDAGTNPLPTDGTPPFDYASQLLHFESPMYDVRDDNDPLVIGPYIQGGSPYAGLPDESLLTRYVTILNKPSGEYLSLPAGSFKYVIQSPTAVPGQPGIIQPSSRYEIAWEQVPRAAIGMKAINKTAPPTGYSIDYAIGKLNLTTFMGCQPGTLLCEPPAVTPIRSIQGLKLFRVVFGLKYFEGGFLQAPNPNAGKLSGFNSVYYPPSGGNPGFYAEVTTDGMSHSPGDDTPTTQYHIYRYAEFANMFRVPAAGMTPNPT